MDIAQNLSSFRTQTPFSNLFCLSFNTGSKYYPKLIGVSVELWWKALVCKG